MIGGTPGLLGCCAVSNVLVGAAGEGEQDSPRQPYAAELFELLLERGAEQMVNR
jgi:hypothetical protein